MNIISGRDMSIPSWFPLSRNRGMVCSVLLIALVGVVDYLTGRELQVVPLYLLPVGLATWAGGRRMGILCAILCAMVWLACELAAKAEYGNVFYPYWNALGLLLIFGVVSWMLSGLQLSMTSLEHKVDLRTSELRQEMLKRQLAEEARLQAERLAVVGTMAAQVAHEVRNPLGSMTLNLELLSIEISALAASSSHPAAESHQLVSQFSQELNRIKQVVDGYMLLARLPKIENGLFPLHEFLDQKLLLITPELEVAWVRLVKDFDPRVASIKTDSAKLWQVLVNLIRNARQAMPRGGRLTVRTRLAASELQIAVADTGEGIREEDLPKLFTPFFTTKPDGTGLGLVLVHQIISEMGGQIRCQRSGGSGTTFLIAFPRSLLGIEPDEPQVLPGITYRCGPSVVESKIQSPIPLT